MTRAPRNPARISCGPRYLSIGLGAPAGHLLDPREDHGAALKVAGTERDAAEVIVEKASVSTETAQLAIIIRGAPKPGVEAVSFVVEKRGQPVELVDRAGERRARLSKEISDGGGAVVQRRDRFSNRIAVGRQPRNQLLESIDCGGEL